MKALLSLTLLFFVTNSVIANDIEGRITLGDGTSVVRINIGKEDQNVRRMERRIRRLEAAVRDLQTIVYDLQSDIPVESRYSCTARTCRESTSIHSTSGTNCSFFGMYRTEKLTIWAESGSKAEGIALKRLKEDSDVAKIGSSISCIKLED